MVGEANLCKWMERSGDRASRQFWEFGWEGKPKIRVMEGKCGGQGKVNF